MKVTSEMVRAFLSVVGRHYPYQGSDVAIEEGLRAALEATGGAAQPAAQDWAAVETIPLSCPRCGEVLHLAQPAAQEPSETWICACNMTWMADITYCRGCGREKE